MNKNTRSLMILCLVTINFICHNTASATSDTYTLTRGYLVTIAGTSNLHDWSETVETVTGSGIVTWNSDGSFELRSLNIKMSVRSIKSKEGSIMNNNTYKALKSDDHPDIVFVLARPVQFRGGVVSAKVNLSIAGVTRTIDMNVKTTVPGHGSIIFEGSKTIKMTDYGIKPPAALLGTIRTGDDITIHFKTVFLAGK